MPCHSYLPPSAPLQKRSHASHPAAYLCSAVGPGSLIILCSVYCVHCVPCLQQLASALLIIEDEYLHLIPLPPLQTALRYVSARPFHLYSPTGNNGDPSIFNLTGSSMQSKTSSIHICPVNLTDLTPRE
ncbi:hypothetical protein BU24DRAFT_143838 [Aaosphaeria arxii CBS 175.79]|uniref:Uncharacterized protein n=1 Tax=Aaosphaeria arxii CBS 175.79 TaxID=1450172 RepID=A0A6A5XV70_9PLEO|nr:uncharacterized protein BU24DRAFT_143838 [Aaosphaeria arxii CBS 175.79]KAF2017112.1 hypothetical protein BU24DRAFT_143838 [Aaosphaeria arxii CBS 175.79]